MTIKKLFSGFLISAVFLLSFAGVSDNSFDHSNWDELLQKNVSATGKVNYEGFKASQKELDSYLAQLKSKTPTSSWTKNQTMAYWINAYNAFTVKLILNNYPLKSIMDINNGKAWDLSFIEMNGKSYSLNNIEHDILRAKYGDARIHFAVNCASISCPRLNNKAFTADKLEEQLEKMSRAFINNTSKNSLSADFVKISSLFNWYKGDFTKNGSVIDFINKYSTTKISSSASIQYMEYNWNLNNK